MKNFVVARRGFREEIWMYYRNIWNSINSIFVGINKYWGDGESNKHESSDEGDDSCWYEPGHDHPHQHRSSCAHVSTDSTWGLQSLNLMRLVSPISFIKFDTLPWDWQHESHSHVLKHIREVVMGLTCLISRS